MTFNICDNSGDPSLYGKVEYDTQQSFNDTPLVPHSDTSSFVLLGRSQSRFVEREQMIGGLLEEESAFQKRGSCS